MPVNPAEAVITDQLTAIIEKPTVQVPSNKATDVAEQIVAEVKKSDSLTLALVQSAWVSKINWTQAVALAAMILTYFGIDLDPKTQGAILALIVAVTTIGTWVLKTFFTSTITPSSAKV